MSINVSLTQFLTFTSKISTGAKVNYVKQVKLQPDYDPGFDYWKILRDRIKKIHSNGLPIDSLLELPATVNEKKQANYQRVASKYVSFIKKTGAEYFEVGKARWNYPDELFVNASPELGLKIGDKKFLVKNYYKKKDSNSKITKQNINSTLTLMQLSTKDFEMDSDMSYAVLNLQNGKLIEASPLQSDSVLNLEVDAQTIVNIWKQV